MKLRGLHEAAKARAATWNALTDTDKGLIFIRGALRHGGVLHHYCTVPKALEWLLAQGYMVKVQEDVCTYKVTDTGLEFVKQHKGTNL